jgi:hypothetical protein
MNKNRFQNRQEKVREHLNYAYFIVNKYFYLLPFEVSTEVRNIFENVIYHAGFADPYSLPPWKNPSFFIETSIFPGTLLERIQNILKFIARQLPPEIQKSEINPVISEFEILIATERLLG